MPKKLNEKEHQELIVAFEHLTNYSSDDPTDPIDPITYLSADGDNCLHIAACNGDVRSVELLLKAGFNINEKGDLGYTSLHYAVSGGHKKVVALLLEKGAETNIRNEFGKYAFKKDEEDK